MEQVAWQTADKEPESRMPPDRCPWCDADLAGDPIPAAAQLGAGTAHFSRVVGLSDGRTVYAWRCPDCAYVWTCTDPPPGGPFHPFTMVVQADH